MKPWQRGISMDRLATVKVAFDFHDKGLTLGAFTPVKENRIAEWMDRGELFQDDGAVVAAHQLKHGSSVRDFTGEVRAYLPTGTMVVDRFAAIPGAPLPDLLVNVIDGYPAAVHGWVEKPGEARMLEALGLELTAVKIRASSELVGVWCRGVNGLLPYDEVSDADRWALRELTRCLDTTPLIDEVVGSTLEFADHYSSYNKRKSWSAVGLRTFGGNPLFIEKPSEMSRKWKEDHSHTLSLQPEWTEVADVLPRCRAFVESLPCDVERVRLMGLASGGELARHADITDKDSGTATGKVMRLHFPLISNPLVRFYSWQLNGMIQEETMVPGTGWFLDTRKPHRAVNGGTTNRIHLVVDAYSTPELLALFR